MKVHKIYLSTKCDLSPTIFSYEFCAFEVQVILEVHVLGLLSEIMELPRVAGLFFTM